MKEQLRLFENRLPRCRFEIFGAHLRFLGCRDTIVETRTRAVFQRLMMSSPLQVLGTSFDLAVGTSWSWRMNFDRTV